MILFLMAVNITRRCWRTRSLLFGEQTEENVAFYDNTRMASSIRILILQPAIAIHGMNRQSYTYGSMLPDSMLLVTWQTIMLFVQTNGNQKNEKQFHSMENKRERHWREPFLSCFSVLCEYNTFVCHAMMMMTKMMMMKIMIEIIS